MAQSSSVRKDSNVILSNVYKNNATGIRDKIHQCKEHLKELINLENKIIFSVF